MTRYLVGIDGSLRGKRAADWSAYQAQRTGGIIMLMTVVDPVSAAGLGFDSETFSRAAQESLDDVKEYLEVKYPGLITATKVVVGTLIESLVDEAADHDLLVVGSHHGFGAGRTFGNATGLRLSVSSPVPTVVVPTDWRPENAGRGIAVGIGPDESAANAIAFGVQRALALGEPLKLISGWGLPAFLSRPAEMMGGGIAPVGEQFQNTLNEIVSNLKAANPDLVVSGKAEESTSPARAILESSRHSNMLVLGTHSYGTFGRALFGSTTNSVLGNLLVPTVIVPMK